MSEICKEVDIPDVNEVRLPGSVVKRAIWEHHLEAMKEDLGKPKMKDNQFDDFSTEQPYMHEKSVFVGRMAFKIRCKMVPDIPANFKNKFRTKEGVRTMACCAPTARRRW